MLEGWLGGRGDTENGDWGMRNGKMGNEEWKNGNGECSFVKSQVDPWWKEHKGTWSEFVNFVNDVLILIVLLRSKVQVF